MDGFARSTQSNKKGNFVADTVEEVWPKTFKKYL